MKYFVEYDFGGEQFTMDVLASSLDDAGQLARSRTSGTITAVRPYTASLSQAHVLRSAASVVRFHGCVSAAILLVVLMFAIEPAFVPVVLLATLFGVAWLIVILLTFVLTGIAGLLERG